MSKNIKMLVLVVLLTISTTLLSQATNPTPQSLPYSQDFGSLAWTSTTYPDGWQGWTISTSPGSSFNTVEPTADRLLIASSSASTTSGNVHNYDGKIGFLNSASLDLTVVLAITTTGYNTISVTYDIMTIRNPWGTGSPAGTRINEVTLQYRVGISGSFTNLTGIEYQNNDIPQTSGTTPQKLETKNINLPSECNNQSVVQLRWASRQVSGAGARPSFAVDNISISTTAGNQPPSIANVTLIPTLPQPGQAAVVRARIYDDSTSLSAIRCSLRYVVNPGAGDTTWTSVAKDSMKTSDSTFYFTIPGTGHNNKVCYHIWAQDTALTPATTRTPTSSYTVLGNLPPTIGTMTRIPSSPGPGQAFVVRARIYDDFTIPSAILCSLKYVTNPPAGDTTWIVVAKDSMKIDTFFFAIPGQTSGTKICYHIWAKDDSGASTRNATASYTITAAPIIRILTRPRYVQGGAGTGTPGTGTPFAIYAGVKPGAANDSFHYKGRIGTRGLTWHVDSLEWWGDAKSWIRFPKITTGAVTETTKIWVPMKALPASYVDTLLSFRVTFFGTNTPTYDSPIDTIKIMNMTGAGDGGWLYGHIYESDGGPVRQNAVVLAYQSGEVVGSYITENNNIREGYDSLNIGYIRMAVKSGTIDSLQVRNRTTNARLSFYTQVAGAWTVYAGDSTCLDVQLAPIITNISRNPIVPLSGQSVTVTAKIYDQQTGLSVYDTLFYAVNTQTSWTFVLRNGFDPADSIFNYTIPSTALQGDTIFYKIHATDGDANRTISGVSRYTIPFERTISQIQQGTGPASPDTNKYVHTKGIVTGVFGPRFFFEQRPGGAWNGLYVFRRVQDSLPKLNIGDSVGVVGIVKEYFTLTEIDAGYNLNGAVNVLASGRPLPCTTVRTISGVIEDYEGCLIRVDSLRFRATGTFASATNYWVLNKTVTESLRVRIDANSSGIIGQLIPTDTISIICNLGAFKDTFQLMPRVWSDFVSYVEFRDVGVTGILSPTGTIYQGNNVPVKVIIRNFGNVTTPTFPVIFTVSQEKAGEYLDTAFVTLSIGQIDTVQFEDLYSATTIYSPFRTDARTALTGDANVHNDTVTGSFEVIEALIGNWVKLGDSMPPAYDVKPGKSVKDGGSMVAAGNDLYAFHGNKSRAFFKYTTTDGWQSLESIPYGLKPTDSLKINKKKIGKGASLCYDGTNIIYATKGNGTKEFWAYYIHPEGDIPRDTWIAKAFVPAPKALKGGTSIAYYDGKVYLLAGGQKLGFDNFFKYDTNTNAWTPLTQANTNPDNKVYKDGSCIVKHGNLIYALKGGGKNNYFYTYNIATGIWNTMYDSVPLLNVRLNKKNKVKDGAAMTVAGNDIYLIKGGGKQDFYKYSIASSQWTELDTIPKGSGGAKRVPKTGAALAYYDNMIYLLKGNNTNEFWQYGPISTKNSNEQRAGKIVSGEQEVVSDLLTPRSSLLTTNMFSNRVRYTIPNAGNVSVKLYNATGRLVETLINEHQNAGSYSLEIRNSTLEIPRGVYFLKYEANNNKSEVKLIVQ